MTFARCSPPKKKTTLKKTTIQGPKYAGGDSIKVTQLDPTGWRSRFHHLKGHVFPITERSPAEFSGRDLFPNHPKKRPLEPQPNPLLENAFLTESNTKLAFSEMQIPKPKDLKY